MNRAGQHVAMRFGHRSRYQRRQMHADGRRRAGARCGQLPVIRPPIRKPAGQSRTRRLVRRVTVRDRRTAPAGTDTGRRLGAVGLCSAAHIPVLLDRHDEVVRPAILWSDQRSEMQVQHSTPSTGLAGTRGAQSCRMHVDLAAVVVALRACEPENYQRTRPAYSARRISFCGSLTGAKATDLASAAAMLMADVPGTGAGRNRTDDLAALAGGRLAADPCRAFAEVAGSRRPPRVRSECRPTSGSMSERWTPPPRLIGCGVIEPQTTGMIMVGPRPGVMALADAPSHHPPGSSPIPTSSRISTTSRPARIRARHRCNGSGRCSRPCPAYGRTRLRRSRRTRRTDTGGGRRPFCSIPICRANGRHIGVRNCGAVFAASIRPTPARISCAPSWRASPIRCGTAWPCSSATA